MRILCDFSYKNKWYEAILFYIIYCITFFIFSFVVGYYDVFSEVFYKIIIAVFIFIISNQIIKKKRLDNKINTFIVVLSAIFTYSLGFLIGLLFTAYLTTKGENNAK